MLLRAVDRELNPALIRYQKDMYAKLRVRLKIPLKQNEMARLLDRTIPFKGGARQGAIALTLLFQ